MLVEKLKITEKTPIKIEITNPTIAPKTFEKSGFLSFISSVTTGIEPAINPANKHTKENFMFSRANLNGIYKIATAAKAPIKKGKSVKTFFQKRLENKSLTAAVILSIAPKTRAIVPPEIPGIITAVPMPTPVNPSLTMLDDLFFM